MAVISGVLPYSIGYGSTAGPSSYDSTNRPAVVLGGIKGPVDKNAIILKSSDPKYTPVYVSNRGNRVTFKVMSATFAALPNHEHTVPADTSGTTANAEINASGYLAVDVGGSIEGASAGTPAYGASAEVADGTDLSGVTFSAIAVGN